MAWRIEDDQGGQRPGLHQRHLPSRDIPSEYPAGQWMESAEHKGIALAHIQPGKPQQNAYAERYSRTVRHEWLDLHIFENIDEVQQIATEWLWSDNNARPNMGNGGMTPAQKLRVAA